MSIEREWKLALSAEEARRIDAACGPPTRVVFQRNHYLDTAAGELRAHAFGLRLREERDRPGACKAVAALESPKYWVTLKGPADRGKRFYERSELQFEVTARAAQAILAGRATPRDVGLDLPEALSSLTHTLLVPLGRLANERRFYRLQAGSAPITLEVDRTSYPDGTVERELEVSWTDASRPVAEEILRAALDRIGVGWRLSPEGKFARFLERSGRARDAD